MYYLLSSLPIHRLRQITMLDLLTGHYPLMSWEQQFIPFRSKSTLRVLVSTRRLALRTIASYLDMAMLDMVLTLPEFHASLVQAKTCSTTMMYRKSNMRQATTICSMESVCISKTESKEQTVLRIP